MTPQFEELARAEISRRLSGGRARQQAAEVGRISRDRAFGSYPEPTRSTARAARLATALGSSVKVRGTSKRAADVYARSLPTRVIRVGKPS
jgi:hypothetical protein